jgi:MFS family permease
MNLTRNNNNNDGKTDSKGRTISARDDLAPPSSTKISAEAWKITAILSCVATMVMYAETMLIPAIPDLIKDFGVSYSMSSWILAAYLLTGAVMTPIIGKLSDYYGRKKVLLIVMVIYMVGVSAAGFATDIVFMLVARAIQGIGLAMFPIAFGIVRDQFPRDKISIGQGIITSMFASGAVIGLLVGGFIIQNYGWQTTFFTIIPIAISLLFIIRRYITVDEQSHSYHRQVGEDKHSKKQNIPHIDIKGALTLAAAVTSFLLVLTYMETGTGTESLTYALVAVATISFTLFIIIERRVSHPLIDLKIVMNKAILPASLIIMIIGLLMFMVFQTIPILVRNPQPLGFGEDAIATGNVQLPFALVLLVFGASSGFIISKLGTLKPIVAGSVITAASFFSLLIFHSSELGISASLALLSVGLSLTSVGAMNVIILTTPKQAIGATLGTTLLMRVVGSSIGPALAGMFMQANQSVLGISGIAQSFPSLASYNMIFLTAGVLACVSIVLAILLRHRVMKMSIPNLV